MTHHYDCTQMLGTATDITGLGAILHTHAGAVLAEKRPVISSPWNRNRNH